MKATNLHFNVQAQIKHRKANSLRLKIAVWLCELAGKIGRTTVEVDIKQGGSK